MEALFEMGSRAGLEPCIVLTLLVKREGMDRNFTPIFSRRRRESSSAGLLAV
jgi:hypothetical protein